MIFVFLELGNNTPEQAGADVKLPDVFERYFSKLEEIPNNIEMELEECRQLLHSEVEKELCFFQF